MKLRAVPYDQIAPLRDAMYEHTRSYSSLGADYSATSILKAPRIVMLEKKHWEYFNTLPLDHDAIARALGSFRGNAIHDRFESMLWRFMNKNQQKGYLIERRLWDRINDRRISGKFDVYLNSCLYDFKTTSVWKAIFGDTDDWVKQLNIYSYFLRLNKIDVSLMKIIAWFMDWNKYDYQKKQRDGYPENTVMEYTGTADELWPMETQKEFIHHRIELLKQNEDRDDFDLDPCTPEDMWEKPTLYCVRHPKEKKSLRNLKSKDEALDWISKFRRSAKRPFDKESMTIEVRPGCRTRCTDWCRVNVFCNQYQEYQNVLQEKQVQKEEGDTAWEDEEKD